MEARLLCLEGTRTGSGWSRTWLIANGTGVPVSQGQVPTTPPPIIAADTDRRTLIHYLTAEMAQPQFSVAEPGWSKWFVGTFVEFYSGY